MRDVITENYHRKPRWLATDSLRHEVFHRRLSLYENRIAEFMCSVVQRFEFLGHALKCRVISKRSQQVVMAGAGLMRPRENRIDDTKLACRTDTLRRQTLAGFEPPIKPYCGFKCTHDGSSNCDNASSARPYALDFDGG